MELKVNDFYRVVNDDCYFAVQKRRVIGQSKKNPELNGTDVWEMQTFHARLEDAYASLLDKSIAMTKEFTDLIVLLKDVKQQLTVNVKG
jgi:hypothetical protein